MQRAAPPRLIPLAICCSASAIAAAAAIVADAPRQRHYTLLMPAAAAPAAFAAAALQPYCGDIDYAMPPRWLPLLRDMRQRQADTPEALHGQPPPPPPPPFRRIAAAASCYADYAPPAADASPMRQPDAERLPMCFR